ncbi:MAG: hypothetical protein U0527_11565 [Candidatus Eisenbacteria bacterium]
MHRSHCILVTLFVTSLALTSARAEGPSTTSIGSGTGLLTGASSSDCAPLILRTDGGYENAISWKNLGEWPPYWGAFADQFTGPLTVCGVAFDLTQIGNYNGQLANVYIWNDHLGQPGSVRYVATDLNLGEIATWPSIGRHVVEVVGGQYQPGPFWVGIWGNWPEHVNGWFMAADQSGSTGANPLTNVRAGIGFEPAGWQPVSSIVGWEAVTGLGIGILASSPNPSGVPDAPIVAGSWGKVKSLYQ